MNIGFIKDYLFSLDIDKNVVETYFSQYNFDTILALKMPNVCLVEANRSNGSKTHQSHIHITGENMFFFYPQEFVSSVKTNTDWKKLDLDVLDAGNNFVKTFTFKKIGCRKNQKPQVQISYLKEDGIEFKSLRKTLYLDDLLVFLKNYNTEKILALRIPKDYYTAKGIDIKKITLTTEKVRKSIKRVLSEVSENFDENDLISNPDEIEEIIYQQQINDNTSAVDITSEDYQPQEASGKLQRAYTRSKTSAVKGKKALKENNYKCLINSEHKTFITRNDICYLEAHHLIPMSKQDLFENTLDTVANIIPLCPHCHRKIHYGKKDEVSEMLSILYNQRKEKLEQAGINITLEQLQNFYC